MIDADNKQQKPFIVALTWLTRKFGHYTDLRVIINGRTSCMTHSVFDPPLIILNLNDTNPYKVIGKYIYEYTAYYGVTRLTRRQWQLFTLFHEYCHVIQYYRYGTIGLRQLQIEQFEKVVTHEDYRNMPIEQEADAFAVKMLAEYCGWKR